MTTICSVVAKPALIPWAVNSTLDVCRGAIAPGVEYAESYLDAVWDAAKKANRGIKSEAASRGTDLHKSIESRLKCGERLSDVLQTPDGREFENSSVECLERKIYSRRHRYSGTFDALIRVEQNLFLIDWKTGKSIYPEFRLQTAAYQAAWEEEHPDQPIVGRYIVRIAEDGTIEPHFFPRSTYRLDFKAFLGAKALYDRLRQIEKSSKSL